MLFLAKHPSPHLHATSGTLSYRKPQRYHGSILRPRQHVILYVMMPKFETLQLLLRELFVILTSGFSWPHSSRCSSTIKHYTPCVKMAELVPLRIQCANLSIKVLTLDSSHWITKVPLTCILIQSVNTMGLQSDAASTFSRILKRFAAFTLTLARRMIFFCSHSRHLGGSGGTSPVADQSVHCTSIHIHPLRLFQHRIGVCVG